MKFRLLYLFLFFVAFASLEVNAQNTGTKASSSRTHSLVYTTNGGELSLLGKHQIGTKVLLLIPSQKKHFATKVVATQSEVNQQGEKVNFSQLEMQPFGFDLKDISSTAVINPGSSELVFVDNTENVNVSYLSQMHGRLLREKHLEKSLKKNAENTPVNEYLGTLKNRTPAGFDFTISGKLMTILEYPDMITAGGTGPRYLVIQSRIIPLSGQCSGAFNIYRLGTRYYLYSPSHCCECGLSAEEVFELSVNGVKKIFSDYSFSD